MPNYRVEVAVTTIAYYEVIVKADDLDAADAIATDAVLLDGQVDGVVSFAETDSDTDSVDVIEIAEGA